VGGAAASSREWPSQVNHRKRGTGLCARMPDVITIVRGMRETTLTRLVTRRGTAWCHVLVASGERSFSKLKLLKIYLRTTMS
jgi:hypothetical protein